MRPPRSLIAIALAAAALLVSAGPASAVCPQGCTSPLLKAGPNQRTWETPERFGATEAVTMFLRFENSRKVAPGGAGGGSIWWADRGLAVEATGRRVRAPIRLTYMTFRGHKRFTVHYKGD